MIDYKKIANKRSASKPVNKKEKPVKPADMSKTSNVMSKTRKKKNINRPSSGSSAQENRKFSKIKQRSKNTQNPFTSSANPSDIPRKVRTSNIVDDKSKRGNRKSSLNRKPVTSNIGESKTSGSRTLKTEQARKSKLFPPKNKSLNTSGRRTTKIEQDRKANISLKRAGGGKIGSKFFTGGSIHASFGTEFDDR